MKRKKGLRCLIGWRCWHTTKTDVKREWEEVHGKLKVKHSREGYDRECCRCGQQEWVPYIYGD